MNDRIAFFLKDFFPYIIGILIILSLFVFFILLLLKSSLASKTKKILVAVAFFIVSTVLVFSIFEGYFRYIYDESDGLGFLKVNKRWYQRHVVYNNYFKRDKDFKVEKTLGVTRIGIIGDSITFGQGIAKTEDRFSDILENRLKENGINIEVYNLGVPGLDSHEEIKLYQEISHLNFDVIVWQYYLNDIQPADKGEPARIITKNTYVNDLVHRLSNASTFFDFIYWRFSSKYAKTFGELNSHYLSMYENPSISKNHEEELAKFISNLKEENKKIVVIIFPFLELIGPNYPAIKIHDNLESFFKSHGVEVIDLLDDFKDLNSKELIASKFDTHPNEKVHKLAAEKLYEKIYSYLK